MNYTPYLNLYKPNPSDDVEVADSLSENFDKIDNNLGALSKNSVNVLSYGAKGDGVTDDTAAFNNAINAISTLGRGVLLVPPGTYMINGVGGQNDYPTGGIKLKSNVTMIMHGALLKVIPNNSEQYACINITDCDNVSIYGGTVQGERDQHTPSPNYTSMFDQWGYGVAIVGSRNVHIENVITRDCSGDGFYIGHLSAAGTESTDFTLKDCIADRNSRNGLSITGAVRGIVEGCVFKNTFGVAPECGLDVEPNPGRVVEGIQLIGNQFFNNNQHGLLFASIQTTTRSGKYCVIIGNEARGNKLSGFYNNRADYNLFENNVAVENKNNGFSFLQSTHNTFNNNKAIKNDYHGIMFGDGSNDNELIGNSARGNSQATHNTYDQFNVWSSSRNNIQANTARHLGLTNKARYGLYIDNTSADNLVTNNDLRDSISNTTGGFNNAAASTIKGAGNRGQNGTFSTNDFI